MRVFSVCSSAVPKQIQVFVQKFNSKVEAHIPKVDEYRRIPEAFKWRSLWYGQFSIAKTKFFNILGL